MRYVHLYVAALLLFLSLSYREPFYNPVEPIARPENFPDHSGHRTFMKMEKIIYELIMTPSITIEEKAYLEDFLNLIQGIPETTPPTQLNDTEEGNSTVKKLQHVKTLLLQEFDRLQTSNAAYIPVKNAIYFLSWLLKNIFI
uniref:Uncharacterized protein n=1 Tax=viral metagenome TaxID=1070528 RepID=A0A6C0HMH8_9ZZZZ